MKRFIILVLILLTGSLCIMTVFAASEGNISQPLPTPKQSKSSEDKDVTPSETTTTAKSEAKVNPLADPNKVKAAVKAFDGMEEALEQVDRKSTDEIRHWLQREADNRMSLAKSAHDQVEAEIMFIRKLAVEEGAKKTTAAIDGILLSRQERFDKLIEKFQEEKRELRRTRTTPRSRYRPGQRYPQERRIRSRQSEETKQRN